MLRVALDMLYVLIGLIARIVERIAAPLAWLLAIGLAGFLYQVITTGTIPAPCCGD